MSMFRSIVFTAALSGLVVGLAVTGIQHLGTVPLIQQGEVYEEEARKTASTAAPSVVGLPAATSLAAQPSAHSHAEGTAAHVHGAPAEAGPAWEPAEGLERNAYTALANVLTAMGFALVLGGIFALLGRPIGWREGLFWGLAGFAVFTLAPGLGLPPELPGIPAAPVGRRQIWWLATAAATSLGLWLLVFRRTAWAAILAVGFIVAPHIVGAPQIADAHSNLPEALSRQFVAAVTVTSLLFWVLLGSLTAVVRNRFGAV